MTLTNAPEERKKKKERSAHEYVKYFAYSLARNGFFFIFLYFSFVKDSSPVCLGGAGGQGGLDANPGP